MSVITTSTLQVESRIANQQKSLEAVKNPHNAGSSASTHSSRSSVSLYDVYHLEKGFTETMSNQDRVTLSPLAQKLSQAQEHAEANRDVWRDDPSRLLSDDVNFEDVFKEVESADGGLVFRRVNLDYLDWVQTVPEALMLYEQISRSEEDGIVIISDGDRKAIGLKMQTLAMEERHQTVTNVVDTASELYNRHAAFNELIAEKHPSLAGAEFEFTLDGDALKVMGGSVDGRALSDQQIAAIEKLANGGGAEGKELLETMLSLRTESVNYYNKYTESGRSQPITEAQFDERFGGFDSYLKSFAFSAHNVRFDGPDDPKTYRFGYFSDAVGNATARLQG